MQGSVVVGIQDHTSLDTMLWREVTLLGNVGPELWVQAQLLPILDLVGRVFDLVWDCLFLKVYCLQAFRLRIDHVYEYHK